LQQRCEGLLILQAQWALLLASPVHYASRVQDARQSAEEVMGITSTSKVELQWLPPVVWSLLPAADNSDGEMDLLDMEIPPADEEQNIAPEQLQLGDVLTGIHDDNDDKAEEDINVPIVKFLWDLQHVSTLLLLYS